MIKEMEDARHAQERGTILQALKHGYDHEMVSIGTLAKTLNLVGSPMTRDGLQFSLSMLADSGYVRIWRARDLATWRTDRPQETRPDVVLFARILPKGIGLIDGYVESDHQVSFT